MFGRVKKSAAASAPVETAPHREGAKNRPTPKRKDQEAARKQPFLQAPATGKAGRKAAREERRAQYAKTRAALASGDEKNLPARDAGPLRRAVRDAVDGRYNLGEYLMPVMLVVLLLVFFVNSKLVTSIYLVVYILLVAALVDAYLLWRRTRKKLVATHGEEKVAQERWLGLYCVQRCFQLRRLRLPKPQVERGFGR